MLSFEFSVVQRAHVAAQLKVQLGAYAESCAQPGFNNFTSHFHGDFSGTLATFRAARMFSPLNVCALHTDASSVDTLRALPFLQNAALLADMKSELFMYLANASDVAIGINPVAWWKQQSSNLPNWASTARQALFILPLSAEVERVVSLFACSFGANQDCTLRDYIKVSLMLQYNNK